MTLNSLYIINSDQIRIKMKKRIIISVCALLVIVLLLGFCSALVIPKYTGFKYREGRLISEYYDDAGGHDVIFIGDCEVYESFVPATMWETYGISSYVRGTPQQLTWQSYYLLRETFKYEEPKAVVFNVLALKYGEPQDEAMNRMTLDGMKWSGDKIASIFTSMTEEESFIDYVFPLLRYHSRITQLESDDFKYALKDPDDVSDSGYLMQTDVVPMDDAMLGITGAPLYDYTLPESSMEYLEKMRVLCEEKGCELILIKAPTNSPIYWWYDEWDEQIVEYANEKELAYYNFTKRADEIGIDWKTDSYDGGVHLNVYGAEKLSAHFAGILAVSHGIEDRRSDEAQSLRWQTRIETYDERKKNMEGSSNE